MGQEEKVISLHRAEPQAVREAIQALVDSEQVNQAEIVRQAGVSSSAVSTFLTNTYKGNEQNVADKLQIWLDDYNARLAKAGTLPVAPDWFETMISKRVLSAAMYAQMAGDIVLVYGGAGLGKTKTLRRYAATHPSVWYAEMTKSHSRLNSALGKISHTVGIKVVSNIPSHTQDDIHERVRNTNGLLIIDEAQHLDVSALEAVRGIHDATGIGIVLSGNEQVYTRLTGGSRTAQFAQLFSRIGKRVRLGRPTREDIDRLADAWKIQGSKERDLLLEIALKPGALRAATKTLRLATIFSGNKPISAESIRAAHRDLGGE